MGKKKNTPLLKEGTVRQFMKLADLKSLSDGFITESADYDENLEEQDDDFVPGDDLEMAAPEDEVEMAPEEGAGGVEQAVEAMVGAIADVASTFGVDVEVDGDEGEGDEMALSDEGDLPPEEGAGPEGEMALEGVDLIDEDAIVKETMNRVATRLTNMSREQQLVESVARRVEARMYRRR